MKPIVQVRHGLAALALAGGALAIGATPALAAGPPLPPGCTFDQATGVETCVTSTTTTSWFGPFTTGGFVDGSQTFGESPGTQICFGAGVSVVRIDLENVLLEEAVTTTTTTQRHGLNGNVFSTSTSTSAYCTGGYQAAPYGISCIVHA